MESKLSDSDGGNINYDGLDSRTKQSNGSCTEQQLSLEFKCVWRRDSKRDFANERVRTKPKVRKEGQL
jgi:hypothetical protein